MSSPAIPQPFAKRVTLSRREVAEMLGKSLEFVDSLVADGSLRTMKLRGAVLIIAWDLWRLLGIVSDDARLTISQETDSLLDRIGA